MADTKVKFKKNLLIVENSDLIRAARTPAAKQLLHISPLFVATEINLSGIQTDMALEIKLVKAARDKADAIQKDLLTQLKQLVDDLTVLHKQDQQGNNKAGESAEKRVKTMGGNIDEALVDFGHDVRGALKKFVKIPAGVKSISRGHFRGLKLLVAFKGGQKAAFAEAYEETAKDFDKLGDAAQSAARDEKKQREDALRALQDAVTSFHEYQYTEKKEMHEARDNVEKPHAQAKAKKGADKADKGDKDLQNARIKLDKLKDEQPKNWTKYVIQQARSLQSQLQGWRDQLQQYRKELEAADKEALKSLGELKKDAEEKEKRPIQKVIDELRKLNKLVANRSATVASMTGEYKKWGTTGGKPDAWLKRLERDVATVKTMKDIQAQNLDKAATEMVRVAKKM